MVKIPNEDLWVAPAPLTDDEVARLEHAGTVTDKFTVTTDAGRTLIGHIYQGTFTDRIRHTSRGTKVYTEPYLAVDPDGRPHAALRTRTQAAKMCRDMYPTWLDLRARTALADDPGEAMHRWDAARPRSHKTEAARADGVFGVGPSDLGKCEKAIEYRERPPEDYTPIDIPKSAAIVGTLLHDAITEARRSMYPWRQYAHPVNIPGLDTPGECDEYDPIVGRVVDYKTASRYKWDRNGDDGPPEHEWEQVMLYGFGLAHEGHLVLEVELLYLNRESGEWESFTRPYSDLAAKRALNRLHALIDALDAGESLPRRTPSGELMGPTVNTICARYCPAVAHCWQLDEVPDHRTPEGYLHVQPDDDGAIAGTLKVYKDAQATESASKKAKEHAKALLTGLEPGVYGDYTLKWGSGSTRKDKDGRIGQLDAAMRFAIDTDTPPPDPDELDYPQTTTKGSISVGKVRAAKREGP